MEKEIKDLQYKIYLYMKEKAASYEEKATKEMLRYREDCKRYFERELKTTNLEDLFFSLSESQVVFLGDFHTFDQSSRNLQRIVKRLQGNSLTLGVEFIDRDDQEEVNYYLKNTITEIEFLESINYSESWHFPWSHYRPFFEMAKEYSLEILALNSSGSLSKRDSAAAAIIANYAKENPQKKLLILFGELHILPDKLPREVEKLIPNIKQTIIHQNIDEVYWKFSEEDRQSIVKFDDFEFSLQTSPPWVKYESLIYWYENICDDPEFDLHEFIMTKGVKTFSESTKDNFHFFCTQICETLGLQLSSSTLEDFNLYDHHYLELIVEKVNLLSNNEIKSFFKRLIEEGKQFNIPLTNCFYCSNYSLNRLAYLAGIQIFNKSVEKKVLLNSIFSDFNPSTFYLYYFRQQFMGHLASKTINPYRKCPLYKDLEARLQNSKCEAEERKWVEFTLQFIDEVWESEERFSKAASLLSVHQNYSSAKCIGYFLADVFYERYYLNDAATAGRVLPIVLGLEFEYADLRNLMKMILPQSGVKELKKRIF
ncbi:MAG: ChaN family lipoprotein [Halobacteriovoraceae bacterium]|nr:ChaN family lipoprotein [Halobacteriovoraceae bacterium]MBT5094976.1 ChaN family lipoprotein [Halobacteriovoraceae bacterium]